jgi:hypothetical protein
MVASRWGYRGGACALVVALAGACGGRVAPSSAEDRTDAATPPDVAGDAGTLPVVDAAGLDAITAFVEQMSGVWLVGWDGGLRHYSWVRIRRASLGDWTGTAEFLSGSTLASNAPFWPCSGRGSWMIPAKPNAILLRFPEGCPADLESQYTFDPFAPPPPFPRGAILSASVADLRGEIPLTGFKFPDAQCDAAMTTCTDPFR